LGGIPGGSVALKETPKGAYRTNLYLQNIRNKAEALLKEVMSSSGMEGGKQWVTIPGGLGTKRDGRLLNPWHGEVRRGGESSN